MLLTILVRLFGKKANLLKGLKKNPPALDGVERALKFNDLYVKNQAIWPSRFHFKWVSCFPKLLVVALACIMLFLSQRELL